MNRSIRGVAVLAFLVVGLACGGGARDEAMPSVDLASHDPAAHIVCTREDGCGKGFICLGGLRCAQLCKKNSDCPTGQTCSGNVNGQHFCQ
jgi:Cys-rich repeat protein